METKKFKNNLINILENKNEKNKKNNLVKIKDNDNFFLFELYNFFEKKYDKCFWVKFDNYNNPFLNSFLIYKYINYFLNFFLKTYFNINFIELQILDVRDQTYPYINDFIIIHYDNKILFNKIQNKKHFPFEFNLNENIDFNKIDNDDIKKEQLEDYDYYEINIMFIYE